MSNQNNPQTKNSKGSLFGVGMAIGIAIGAGIGVAMDNLAVGMAIGIARCRYWGNYGSATAKQKEDELK